MTVNKNLSIICLLIASAILGISQTNFNEAISDWGYFAMLTLTNPLTILVCLLFGFFVKDFRYIVGFCTFALCVYLGIYFIDSEFNSFALVFTSTYISIITLLALGNFSGLLVRRIPFLKN
jgi:ABC-type proline/glycine betaine transport system permease subunit